MNSNRIINWDDYDIVSECPLTPSDSSADEQAFQRDLVTIHAIQANEVIANIPIDADAQCSLSANTATLPTVILNQTDTMDNGPTDSIEIVEPDSPIVIDSGKLHSE